MRNLLSRAAARLEQRRNDYAALSVLFCRSRASDPGDAALVPPSNITMTDPDDGGNVTIAITVNATVGQTPFDLEDASGVNVRVRNRDYLILIADLAAFWAIAFGDSKPVRGDFIIDRDEAYEVMAMPGKPESEVPGGYGNTFRIHTKKRAS
jgi:hypothetical protein